jgi:hypothetical protein
MDNEVARLQATPATLALLFTFLLTPTASPMQASSARLFEGERQYNLVGSGSYVVGGDFNGDGKADVAASHGFAGRYLLHGNGDGTFQPVSGTTEPLVSDLFVATGDFNGDGKIDRAERVWSNPDRVAVSLGIDPSGYQFFAEYPVGERINSVDAADFDHDLELDLVVSVESGVKVLRGNGDGSFGAPLSSTIGAAFDVALGDFDSDGRLDVAALRGNSHIAVGVVAVAPGNGDGTFRIPPSAEYSVDGYPWAVVVSDFDRDGHADLATANGLNTVSVFRGQGTGSFSPPVYLPAGSNPRSIAIADWNGDGSPDLATANHDSHDLSVLLNKGDGTFQPRTDYFFMVGTPWAVAAADFDLDGRTDLVASVGASVSVFLGNGSGALQAPIESPAGPSAGAIAIGDFNRDGRPDVAVTNVFQDNTVSVLLGNADGTFQPRVPLAAGEKPWAIAAGDVNRDGKVDLAVASFESHDVNVFLGAGDGTFGAGVSHPTGSPIAIVIGDFTGDGLPDLAAANHEESNVTLLVGDGNGSFANVGSYDVGFETFSLAAGDLDADARPDLVSANVSAQSITLLRGTQGTVVDPRVSIRDVMAQEGDAGSVSARFQLRLEPPFLASLSLPVTVSYATSDITARAGLDYVAGAGLVTFPPGTLSAAIDVPVLGDTLDEPNEAFILALEAPRSVTLPKPRAQAVILDDDGRAAVGLPIAVVPTTLSMQGMYKLAANLSTSQLDGCAITVASDFVTVDLGGFKLGGGGAGLATQARGVCGTDRKNVTVRNGSIRGFWRGVELKDSAGTFTASQGHLLDGLRLDGNTQAGLWIEGRALSVRRNAIVATGGTTFFGSDAEAVGLHAAGPGLRVLENEVSGTWGTGAGATIGIRLRHAGAAVLESNRVSGDGSTGTGVLLESGADLLAARNRLAGFSTGLVFTGALGKYRDTLTSGVATPYIGGTDAGNNQ